MDLSSPAVEAEGRRNLQRSADCGDPEGMLGLAWSNHMGVSASRDRAFDIRWLVAAAEEGDADLKTIAGVKLGFGCVPPDYTDSLVSLRNAAQAGNAEAMHFLSIIYSQGRGTPIDLKESGKWLQESADAVIPLPSSSSRTRMRMVLVDFLRIRAKAAGGARWTRIGALNCSTNGTPHTIPERASSSRYSGWFKR